MNKAKRQKFAKAVAANPQMVGFDPTILIPAVMAIIQLIQNCKKKELDTETKTKAMVGKELERLRNCSGECCPPRVRRMLKREHGIIGEKAQDQIYFATITQAAAVGVEQFCTAGMDDE